MLILCKASLEYDSRTLDNPSKPRRELNELMLGYLEKNDMADKESRLPLCLLNNDVHSYQILWDLKEEAKIVALFDWEFADIGVALLEFGWLTKVGIAGKGDEIIKHYVHNKLLKRVSEEQRELYAALIREHYDFYCVLHEFKFFWSDGHQKNAVKRMKNL